ncbi:MAG: energy transducer TonB [Acidobacteria bacterium]|nr:energy transducer TonB [Acidobacteriota bacterium]
MKELGRTSLLLAALVAGALPGFAQTGKPSVEPPPPVAVEYSSKAWKEFSSAEGRFTVLLPGTPTPQVQTQDTAIGKLDVHTFTLTTSMQYGVMFVDYPRTMEDSGAAKQFLDGARDGGVKGVNGTLLEEKETSLDGHPGRIIKVRVGDGYVMRVKFYVVKNRLYQLGVTMWDKDAPEAAARFHDETAARFLDSFKLTSGPVGETSAQSGEAQGQASFVGTEGEVDRLLKRLREENKTVIGNADDAQAQQPSSVRGVVVSGGVLNGKAIVKPQPVYPTIAKAARAQGTVVVQIIVDEDGKVMAAQAVSGHPLLQAAAVKAAREAQLSPTRLSGKPVKVSGVITYNFVLQ